MLKAVDFQLTKQPEMLCVFILDDLLFFESFWRSGPAIASRLKS